MSDHDTLFMRRAIRLAMNGRGLVEPNPMVGCVIVKKGRVIGEAWHDRFGGPHAEPRALAACAAAGESAEGATAYVTLEPCCHTNKKTPPCVPLLIEAKVARVVVGCLDPNPDVNGKGLTMLREAGIAVDGPVLEAESKQLIAPFLATIRYRRPYVSLKWAQFADGKVSGAAGRRIQISNPASVRAVHELRARCDVILVGINTVLVDDPQLTVREVPIDLQPLRVVLDRDLRFPLNSRMLRAGDDDDPVYNFCSPRAAEEQPDRVKELTGSNVEVRPTPLDATGQVSLRHVLKELGAEGSVHLLVEPGPTLARSFFRERLADRVWLFRSPHPSNADSALQGATVPPEYAPTGEIALAGDRLTEYLNPKSDVFSGPYRSADFVLASEAHAKPIP